MTELDKKTMIMRYIEWYLGMYGGKSPSIRRISQATGITSIAAVQESIKALEREGYITTNPVYGKRNVSLNIRLTAKRMFQ